MTYAMEAARTSLPHVLRRSQYAVRELFGVVSVDAKARRAHYELLSSSSVSMRREMFKQHLAGLHRQWRADTRYSSSLEQNKAHPAYQAIVALGEEAIPLILEQLETKPDLLVMALHDITGKDPVRPEHHGRIPSIIQDWLAWGSEHGYRR